jgi:hypothetical protein
MHPLWGIVFIIVLAMYAITLCLLRRAYRARRSWRASDPVQQVGGREEPDDFPYWAKTLPPPARMFRELRAVEYNVCPSEDGDILMQRYPEDSRVNRITDHFTEAARVDCRAGRMPTPREAWAALDPERRKNLLAVGAYAELREEVYNATRECNTFNPTFARWIVEQTSGPGSRVLDPSSGWGDRLIGALAAGAGCYHGFDPNPRLQAGYSSILETLRPAGASAEDFWVKELPFEEARLEGEYDLAFTSPPYFAYEEYVAPGQPGEDAQSIGRYPDYAAWVVKMYVPYLLNAYRHVRPGGWIVMYIEDTRLDGKKYPLRSLTKETLERAGAIPARNFGLSVVVSPPTTGGGGRRKGARRRGAGRGGGKKPAPRVRWALGWKKPNACSR